MEKTLKVGDNLPKFSCKDQEEHHFSNKDFEDGPYLFFFLPLNPSDNSIKIATELLTYLPDFEEYDTMLIGVSPNDCHSHRLLMDKHQLLFPLLSDENMDLCRKFCVIKNQSVEPSVFLIDSDGKICWMETPTSDGIGDRVLGALESHLG